jgi:hypothetical protein
MTTVHNLPAPAFPLNPITIPEYPSPKTAIPPSGERRQPPPYAAFNFTVATDTRLISRIYSLILQFRAHPSEVSLRLRTGASPVLHLWPPQADKQAAERTTPPPALHFHISPHTAAFTRTIKHRGELSAISPPKAAHPSHLSYFGGGVLAACIVPLPRRRASPSQKTIGGVFSLQSRRTIQSQTRPLTA